LTLPRDWRDRWVRLVTGRGGDPGFLSGGPILDATEGLGVYQDAWRLRHLEALRVETPGLTALVGDRIEELAAGYFAEHPSRSFTLDRIADRLADWLAERGEPPEVVEMARLDHRVMRSFSAGEHPPVVLDGGLPPLALQPHAAFLRNTTDVHLFRTAVILGAERPAITARPTWLAIWRVGRAVQTLEIPPATWAILAGMEAGLGVAAALEQAFAEGHLEAGRLDLQIAEAFRLAATHGLIGLDEG
jgi:hypothetical protein